MSFRHFSIKNKLLALFLLLNAITVITYSAYGFFLRSQNITDEIDQRLQVAANTVPDLLGEDYLHRASGIPIADTEAVSNTLKLGRYAQKVGLAYLYVVRRNEAGKVIYVSDGGGEEEIRTGNFKKPGGEYTAASEGLKATLADGQRRYDEYTDSFGHFRSTFIPAKLSTGEAVVLCADIRIDHVQALLTRSLLQSIFVGLACFVVGGVVAWWLTGLFAKTLVKIGSDIEAIAKSRDLGRKITIESDDEIGRMAGHFNHMLTDMRGVLQDATGAAATNSTTANTLKQSCQDMASSAADSATRVKHVTGYNQNIHNVAKGSATQARELAERIHTLSHQLGQAHDQVESMVAAVNRNAEASTTIAERFDGLAQNIRDITQILARIAGISDQTNLLALNAAIEAARAGEAGRGFAVVADEVRKLASQTQATLSETNTFVGRVLTTIESTMEEVAGQANESRALVAASHTVIDTIEQTRNLMNDAADVVAQTANNAEAIRHDIEAVGSELTQINHAVETSSGYAQTIRHKAEELGLASGSLNQTLASFKV